jgi:hypothetical protein
MRNLAKIDSETNNSITSTVLLKKDETLLVRDMQITEIKYKNKIN